MAGGEIAHRKAECRPALSLTSPVTWIAYNKGFPGNRFSMSAVCFATSDYEPPAVLRAIASDTPKELEISQRSSLSFEDLVANGIDPKDPRDYPLLEAIQLSAHPQVVPAVAAHLPAASKYGQAASMRLRALKKPAAEDTSPRYALTRVHVRTFRTPQFMLSCAQDWRKGDQGYQQHVWTGVLGDEAQIFTTQPHLDTNRVNRWAGNGCMPKAVMHRNVLVCLYRVPDVKWATKESHAWFPRFAFDDVVEQNGWVFARKGDGFAALRSQQPAEWVAPGEKFFKQYWYTGHTPAPVPQAKGPVEYLANGARNAWLCELGNPALHGTFARFVESISAAKVQGDESRLSYESPSVGLIQTGWDLPLTVAGKEIPTQPPERFATPYCQARFGERAYQIRHRDAELQIGRA